MDTHLLQAHYLLALHDVKDGKLDEARKTIDMIIAECMKENGTETKEVLYKTYKLKLDVSATQEVERNNVSAVMLQIFGEDNEYGARVFYDLAQYHKMTHDQDRYADALIRLQKKYPNNEYRKDIFFELALIQQNQNDMKAAIKNYLSYLSGSSKKNSNVTIAAVNLATCYTAIEKNEEAKAVLKRYLKISPK